MQEHDRGARVAFTLAQGRRAGLSDAVMRRAAYDRPFRGVRATGGPDHLRLVDRCAELRVVMAQHAVFSHGTAARLWGMPLPHWTDERMHVTNRDDSAMRRHGVIGWRRTASHLQATMLSGLPVTTPAETWVTLATMTDTRGGRMPREWLVAIGDFLVSGRRLRFGREKPLATHAQLVGALARHGSGRGAASLDWALDRIRQPVDSPPETFLRLGLVAGRMPEPEVQPAIMTALGLRHPDLGYIDRRLLLEYLGDVHRTDPDVWRKDLQRVQLFEDAGYRTILVGAADLTRTGLPALQARVRRALSSPRGR